MRSAILCILAVLLFGGSVSAQNAEMQRCVICAVAEGAGPEPVHSSVEFEGRTFFFCKQECRERFAADPVSWSERFEKQAQREGAVPLGPLPELSLPLDHGQTLQSADWKGKVLVLDFWATWCAPCVKAIPELIELQRQHAEDLQVIGFAYDKDAAVHSRFLQERQLNYPSVLAHSESVRPFLRKLFKQVGPVRSIPVTLLVNRQGEIVFRQTGPMGAEFKQALQEALRTR